MKPTSPAQAIERLIELDWKAFQIAAEIGVSKSTISKIRNAQMMPSFKIGADLIDLAAKRRKPPKKAKQS